MKTHGTIRYGEDSGKWFIHTEAHVRMKLRRVFAALVNARVLAVDHTPSNCLDLEWVLERYPHDMTEQDRARLASTCEQTRERAAECALILTGSNLPPMELAVPLRDYQKLGVALVTRAGGLLCGDDLGLGKTAVGIGLIANHRPALVVCQTHLQRQWRKEIAKFAPMLSVMIGKTTKPHPVSEEILILPYSKLHGWKDVLHGQMKTVVFDECQELRRSGSSKYEAAAFIAEKAAYRLGLSATPVYNYGGEIHSILEILQPGMLGSLTEFGREWCSHVTARGHYVVADPEALGSYLREQHLMLRRRRKDVGRELPPVQRLVQDVPYVESIMEALRGEALQLARTILSGAKFEERGQAAREFDIKLRQATGISKAPFVAEIVADMAAAGEKVLLFGWHREVYAVWEEKLKEAGTAHWFYTGEESDAAKAKAIEEFTKAEGGAVLIMSLRSGAGVDGLQKVSSTAVFGEMDWSPQVHEQCGGRLSRDGQDNPVTLIYLVSEAGSDPIIAQVLGLKMEQARGIVDPDSEPVQGPRTQQLLDSVATHRVTRLAQDFVKRYGNKRTLDLELT